jgi:hypothetical protein
MTIYDTIVWLRSLSSDKLFPTVQFNADTDMATMGWISLTSVVGPEIVVTQLTPGEFEIAAADSFEYVRVEDRVNAILCRDDLRVPWLERIERRGPQATDLSWEEFRNAYRPARLLYRDILVSESLAEEAYRQSRKQFEHDGGRLWVL